MRLIRIEQFRRQFFGDDAAPSPRTVRHLIETGALPGRKIGGTFFVDADAWRRQTLKPVEHNPDLEKILQDGAA